MRVAEQLSRSKQNPGTDPAMWRVWKREWCGEVAKASLGTEFVAILQVGEGAAEPSRGWPKNASASLGEDLSVTGSQAPPTDAWPPSLNLGARRLARRTCGGRGMTCARRHNDDALWRGEAIWSKGWSN